MAITPADIEKKTFSTALRGYDLDEVDDFLDEMVVAFRELEGELAQARTRVGELERDPSAPPPAPVPLVASGPDESAVGRALVAAQQAADRLLEDARGDADRMLKESRSEADQLLQTARVEADTFAREREEKQAEVEAEMAEMNTLVAAVRTRLAVLATTVADKLDEMDAVVAGTKLDADSAEDADGVEEIADLTIDAAGDGEIESEGVDDIIDEVDDVDDRDDPVLVADVDEEVGSTEIEGFDGDDDANEADAAYEDSGDNEEN